MKRNFLPVLLGLALIFSMLAACETNNETDLYGVEPCDTTDLTWENGISTIYNAFCVQCHSEFEFYNGIRHDTYEQELLVISDGGVKLRAVINHTGPNEPMPYNAPKLSDCQITMIETWLENGAPEK